MLWWSFSIQFWWCFYRYFFISHYKFYILNCSVCAWLKIFIIMIIQVFGKICELHLSYLIHAYLMWCSNACMSKIVWWLISINCRIFQFDIMGHSDTVNTPYSQSPLKWIVIKSLFFQVNVILLWWCLPWFPCAILPCFLWFQM